jgi:hypothetical protein
VLAAGAGAGGWWQAARRWWVPAARVEGWQRVRRACAPALAAPRPGTVHAPCAHHMHNHPDPHFKTRRSCSCCTITTMPRRFTMPSACSLRPTSG